LVHGDAPEIERSVAVAAEVEVLPIRRPDRVPVKGRIRRDADERLLRLRRIGIDRPEIALAAGGDAPEGDALPVRRPARLLRVGIGTGVRTTGRGLIEQPFRSGARVD